MLGIDSLTQLAVLAVALASIALLAWRIVCVGQPSLRASRARMDAAGERVCELLDKERQKARLLRLDAASPDADALEHALALADDAAAWADRLFARCEGRGAQLYYDHERGHWTACVPLFEGGPTVAFVVDETDRRRPFEALLAALEIVAVDAPPVVDAEFAPSSVCVRFSDVGRWQAYQPCDACGGGWLNTMFDTHDHEPLARLTARRLVVDHDPGHESEDRSGSLRCLHCAMP